MLLLDSRLLGLTLRHSAPVFRCHRVFLDMRDAGTCAGRRACFPFSFSLILLFLLIFANSGSHREISLYALWRCDGPANTRNCFLGSPIFQVLPPYSTTCSGTLECAQKSRRLVALCLGPLFGDYESTNFLKIVSLCKRLLAHQCHFTFSHLHLSERSLSHDRLGMPMEGILDTSG